jgi:hypothetical protein
VIVYRAPTRWEGFDPNFIDKDYTWDMEGPGHELHDTDTQFAYHAGCPDETHGRIHIEFDSEESVDHFTASDWGAANKWWRTLHTAAANDKENTVRCFVKSFVNLGFTCPADVDAACSWHDPLAVAVGVPSLDCSDDPYQGTDEIHPVLGMAIRFQEDPTLGVCDGGSSDGGICQTAADCPGICGPKTTGQCRGGTRSDLICNNTTELCPGGTCIPMGFCSGSGGLCESDANCPAGECRVGQQWAFFYRQTGNTGPCGGNAYSRCLSMFKLPLGLPDVPDNKVLTGADVHLDWHAWRMDDSVPGDVNVDSSFDLTDGTVLTITLPHFDEGVVGLVTVKPAVDTTAPQITCPANVNKPADLGKCTAVVTYPPPTISDDCSVTATCNPPSGSTFPLGTTNVTCTATDQAGLSSSPCGFNVAVTAGNKCPHNAGFWKNHTTWPVSSLMLGGTTYTQAQLLSILKKSTTGDASVILADAEIAALLSLANGSDPTPICATIADADAAFGSLLVPAKISPSTVLGQRMVSDATLLNSFNNDMLTPGCTP